MDKYTKFILTVIAVLLALHLVKPFFIPKEVVAINSVQDVNITKVGGVEVGSPSPKMVPKWAGMPVYVTRTMRQ